MTLEDYRIHYGGDMAADKIAAVIETWRVVAQDAVGDGAEVELAAPFQRHYTRLGTGLPPNFCLALTATEALAFKLDPRHPAHPLAVTVSQVGKQRAAWPRSDVRVERIEPGRLAIGVVFGFGSRTIPCRTPRLTVNPAAALMITTLGGELPID